MPPDVFDVPWSTARRQHVEALLSDARDEALSWEAKADRKGDRLGRHHVAKTVCGFANSRDGGYLIVGAAKQHAGFHVVGIEEPPWGEGDAGEWLDSTIAASVRPRPWYDVRVLAGEPFLAVVAVDPVPDPPVKAVEVV